MKYPAPSTALIYVMASVQATRFARAFVLTEGVHSGLTGIPALDVGLKYAALAGGLLLGAGVSLAIAYTASKWKRMKQTTNNAKQASKDTRWILLGVLLVSPFVLAPTTGAFVTWTWYRAVLLAAIPDVLVAALAFVDTSAAAAQSAKPTAQSSQATAQATGKPRRPAKSTAQSPQTAKVYMCNWPGCGWDSSQSAAVQKGGDPQKALAAHVSHHNRMVRKIEAEKHENARRE